MDDKSCRLEILRVLKKMYDIDSFRSASKNDLTAQLAIEENVLERNLHYLEEKRLLSVNWYKGGFLAKIKSEGIDFLETGEPSGFSIQSPVNIQQVFHGSVGGVAGRDINIQMSFGEVLAKLSETVDADRTIPVEEKTAALNKLRSLAGNKWIQSIGTSVLTELIKKSVGL